MLSFGIEPRAGVALAFKSGRARVRWGARGFAAAVAALIAIGFGACLLPASAAAAARLTMKSGGETRSATIIEHEALKLRRRPLVIVLRPRSLPSPKRHRLAFQEIVESRKPVFIYPEPLAAGWPVAAGPNAERETTFLRDLINRFVGQGVGDPRKIFLVGKSSGGVFAYRAACAGLGRPVAGIATLGAALPADLAQCAFNPMAFIAVNNLGNPKVPFEGGLATIGDASFRALPAETTLSLFAKSSGLRPEARGMAADRTRSSRLKPCAGRGPDLYGLQAAGRGGAYRDGPAAWSGAEARASRRRDHGGVARFRRRAQGLEFPQTQWRVIARA